MINYTKNYLHSIKISDPEAGIGKIKNSIVFLISALLMFFIQKDGKDVVVSGVEMTGFFIGPEFLLFKNFLRIKRKKQKFHCGVYTGHVLS